MFRYILKQNKIAVVGVFFVWLPAMCAVNTKNGFPNPMDKQEEIVEEERLDAMKQRAVVLKNEILERECSITQMNADLAKKDSVIAENNKILVELNKANLEKDKALEEAQAEIARLRNELGEPLPTENTGTEKNMGEACSKKKGFLRRSFDWLGSLFSSVKYGK